MTGICPACGGIFQVKKDGTMRWHVSDASGLHGMCPGVDDPPCGEPFSEPS